MYGDEDGDDDEHDPTDLGHDSAAGTKQAGHHPGLLVWPGPRSPTVSTVAVDETWERLGAITQLLHHPAAKVCSDADRASPDSPLHSLGLGVYLAQARAGL